MAKKGYLPLAKRLSFAVAGHVLGHPEEYHAIEKVAEPAMDFAPQFPLVQPFPESLGTRPELPQMAKQTFREWYLANRANMQTFKFSREVILAAIRSNLPQQQVEHPVIPVFQRPDRPFQSEFEQHLQQAGGTAHNVGTVAEAEAELMALHPGAKVICSAVPEIAGTRRAETVRDPHELADVDVGVVRAQFGRWRKRVPSG